ncbi:hydroxyacylglutathione hydrolase [Neisseriaceae bacterium B1]
MPTITPIPAFDDNYIWLIQQDNRAVVIDPGQAEPVLNYLRAHNLQLEQIWITHHHGDHTSGIAALKNAFPNAEIFGASDIQAATQTVQEGDNIQWHNIEAQVWHTAGHTENHLCFLTDISGSLHVFCGDTLFSAGCGRAFTQRPDWLYHSLTRLNTLPENTLFYPAHEYTANNLRFAAAVEPENRDIQAALENAKNTPTLPVSLAHERKINPFLRTHITQVQHSATEFSSSLKNSEEAVFIALREWKNQF